MKFKKLDPKLQAIASSKKAKSPPPEAPLSKQKGVMILDDIKHRKLTPPVIPLSLSVSLEPLPRALKTFKLARRTPIS